MADPTFTHEDAEEFDSLHAGFNDNVTCVADYGLIGRLDPVRGPIAKVPVLTPLKLDATGLGLDPVAVAGNYVLKGGDTMTGPLVLSAAPTAPLQAATKAYVDSHVGTGGGAFLPLTGGTLTGELMLQTGTPRITLDATAASPGNYNVIEGKIGGSSRWGVYAGNAAVESGGNAGSDFEIGRYTDAGVYGSALIIQRHDRLVLVQNTIQVGAAPTQPMHVANKSYVDSVAGAGITSTDSLAEGTINLYFTSARAVSAAQPQLDAKQPLDSDLTAIAGLAPTDNSIIQRKSAAWTSRTPAQFKIDLALVKGDVGLSAVDNTADVDKPISTATQLALNGKEATVNKAQANGYASLDSGGKVPASQLPAYVDDVVEFTDLVGFPPTGTTGVIYVARDTNKIYRWSGSAYVEISPSPGSTDAVPEGSANLYHTAARAAASAPVQSVAGKTGAVTLVKADVGLANADNTADAAKPISAATQAALDGKQGLDGTLTALGGLDAGAGLVEQTGADVFVKRAIGVAAPTDVLTRADGDGRFAALAHGHTASQVTDFGEAVDDRVAALLVQGANVTLTYDDSANTLTIATTGGGGGALIEVGDIPPATPADKTLWWESDTGLLYLYWNDGTSSQWVSVGGQPGPQGDPGTTDWNDLTNKPMRSVDQLVALIDAVTVALDAALGNVFRLVATANRTVGVPANKPGAGQSQRIVIMHEASGADRTLALTTGSAGAFRFGTSITELTATTSGLTDYIGCIYNQVDDRWDVVSYSKGH